MHSLYQQIKKMTNHDDAYSLLVHSLDIEDKSVLNNLVKLKYLIEEYQFGRENLLFLAISLDKMSWIKKIIKNDLVSLHIKKDHSTVFEYAYIYSNTIALWIIKNADLDLYQTELTHFKERIEIDSMLRRSSFWNEFEFTINLQRIKKEKKSILSNIHTLDKSQVKTL